MLLIELLQVLSAAWLALYGLNSLLLTLVYWRVHRRPRPSAPVPADWPTVTVQLPVYNEVHVIERLIAAAVALDYPRERLQLQVLDDSNDATTNLAQQAVARARSNGVDIQCLHRASRAGFKAGALAEGLRCARGELLAIFDADFVPPPDLLGRLIPFFDSADVGCVQARWGHLNRDYSLLTRLQAIGIDGHFEVEQRARCEAGLLLNFNGSGGVWRRTCIEAAGGWQSDTLAEDLDLSYRAQLAGWRILYVPEAIVPGELPPQMDALRRQQARWAGGSIRVALKLLPAVFRSGLSLPAKIEGALHLTGYLVHPLLLATLLLSVPVALGSGHLASLAPFFLMAAVGPPFLYLTAQAQQGARWWRELALAPLLLLLGTGLALNNSVAMARAALGQRPDFQRTPKFDVQNRTDEWRGSGYALRHSPMVWWEFLLAGLALGIAALEWKRAGWVPLWLLVYAVSYAYVAAASVVQSRSDRMHRFAASVEHARRRVSCADRPGNREG
jgi:cellulose synthase/poly-beta-1,6-N-acetylglucosamine synthase-like glycosyltransferase